MSRKLLGPPHFAFPVWELATILNAISHAFGPEIFTSTEPLSGELLLLSPELEMMMWCNFMQTVGEKSGK